MSKNSESDNSPKRRRKPLDPLAAATLDDVLADLGVTDWDVVLVGDGSGTGWSKACGWAAVLHDRATSLRQVFLGGLNHGTNYLAELLPYIHALLWYTRGPGKSRLHERIMRQPGSCLMVHIITDSEILASQGNGKAGRKENEELWLALDRMASKGYKLVWHWVARDRLGLNQLTDHMSRESRLTIDLVIEEAIKRISVVKPPEGTSIYDYNPAETYVHPGS